MTRKSHQTKRAFLILLSSLVLAGSLGGCANRGEQLREYYDEELKVEEIDDGVYMIAASMHGQLAGEGYVRVMKESVFRKAREHCAQQNKAMKMVNREGQGGSSSSSFGGLTGGGLLGMSAGSSAAGAEFDIVFKCRERTKQ